jgi:hypothetical protein
VQPLGYLRLGRTELSDVALKALMVLDDTPRRNTETDCALLWSETVHRLARKPDHGK